MADNTIHKNLKFKQMQKIAISIATLAIALAILVFISCDSKQTDPTSVPPPSPIVISQLGTDATPEMHALLL